MSAEYFYGTGCSDVREEALCRGATPSTRQKSLCNQQYGVLATDKSPYLKVGLTFSTVAYAPKSTIISGSARSAARLSLWPNPNTFPEARVFWNASRMCRKMSVRSLRRESER